MQIRSLLGVLVACSAFGCASTPNDPAAQPRPEEPIRTGTRLPGVNSGMTGSVTQGDVQSEKSRQGNSASRM